MSKSFDEKQKRLLKLLQGDIPLSATPFVDLAKELAMDTEEVLALLKNWQKEGIVKRLGVLLRHQKSGFILNAMVVWELPSELLSEAGKLLARQREVSHCYERVPSFENRFNLFSMLHLKEMASIEELVSLLAPKIGALDYRIFKSVRELKKTSREYF